LPPGISRPSPAPGQPATPPATPGAGAPSSGANPQARPGSTGLKGQLTRFAERLQRFEPTLRDSPSLKRAVQELSRHIGEDDERWDRLTRGANNLQESLQNWSHTLGLHRWQLDKNVSWPRALTPSSLPSVNWQKAFASLGERSATGSVPLRSSPGSDSWSGFLA